MNRTNIQRPLNITQKSIFLLLTASIFPLFIIGVSSYQAARKALRKEAIRYNKEIVTHKIEYLALKFQQIEGLITNISGINEIIDVLDQTQTQTYINLVTQARIGYTLSNHSNLKGLVSM